MAASALSSFWVHGIRGIGPWSPIHLLSVLAPVSLVFGMRAAMQRDLARHCKIMENLAFWGLGVTGLFTLVPGRTMNAVLFGSERWAGFAAAVIAAAALWALWQPPARPRILGIGIQRGLRYTLCTIRAVVAEW